MAARQVKTSPRKTSIVTTFRSACDALAQSSEAPWKRDNLYQQLVKNNALQQNVPGDALPAVNHQLRHYHNVVGTRRGCEHNV